MNNDSRFIEFDIDSIRMTTWPVVALAVIVDAIVLVVAMHVVLPWMRTSFPLEAVTNNLIQATLVFSLTRFVLVAVGVAIWIGGLRARDVGLQRGRLREGSLVVLGVWIAMQLTGALIGLVATGSIGISPYWTPDRLLPIAGELLAQFLGNAFAEEVIFRGFLLTQVVLMLRAAIPRRGRRLTASVLLSQLVFSLSHIPERIASGYTPVQMVLNLAVTWVWGILFAVLYLRTGNLFVVIGVHALVNAPVTVLAMPSEGLAGLLPLVLSLVLIVIWGPGKRWLHRMQTSTPSDRTATGDQAP